MHLSKITGIAVAALFAAAPAALAQTPSQTPMPAQTQTPASQTQTKTGATAAVQTFTGCLMTEPAYRSAHHLGAGALGGAGLGDEFVLVDAKVSPAKATAETTTSKSAMSSAASSPSSATCADQGVAYRLTGHTEEQLKALVGHQLEVQGRFKHADDVTASGAPTSGNLPAEVEMVSYREAPAPAPVATTTPAPVTQPPAASAPLPPTPAVTAPSTPAPATTEPKELPHAAGSSGLIALIGVLALGSGLVLAVWRRRLA